MTLTELQEIALHAVKGTVPATYANKEVDMQAAFADGLRDLMGSYNQFMKNRYDIYEIIMKAYNEILPAKVIDAIGKFADVQVTKNNQKVMFKVRKGKSRARKFITRAAINGVYETFRLDSDTFTLEMGNVGGGVSVDLQRVSDGAESLAECMTILNEGLVDAVYYEVYKALRAALNASARPAANKVTVNAWDPEKMVKLINVVRAYGNGVAIFAPPEFVGAMGADAIVSGIANTTNGIYHPGDIDAIHNTGYINVFRGCPVVQIRQSFIDETNEKTWIDPQMAYVLPSGGEKVVKVALEGGSLIRDYQNRDGSTEIYAEQKMGAAILAHHNWGIYQNTSITQTFENPYPNI